MNSSWSKWSKFPDPDSGGILRAPIGPGVYQLRHVKTKNLILFGMSKNTAKRMTSLLPREHGGSGTRNNLEKQRYVYENLAETEYRTRPCKTRGEAAKMEALLKIKQNEYVFST